MISFILLISSFDCPSFSSSFRYKVWLFIWDFFLSPEVIWYHCKLSSKNCFHCIPYILYILFLSLVVLRYFLFPFWFLLWPTGCSGVCYLVYTCSVNFSVLLLLLHFSFISLWLEKIPDIILVFLNWPRVIFVVYHMTHSGECFVYTWEERALCCRCIESY